MKRLRICYVIDARSTIAQGWIKHFLASEHDIHIISTRPVNFGDLEGAASVHVIPIGLTRFASKKAGTSVSSNQTQSVLLKALQMIRSSFLKALSFQLIEWLSAIDVYRQAPKVRKIIEEIQPDLVHAMRIPYEGILASLAVPTKYPLLTSVWGNDFTLFAKSIALTGWQTRTAMKRTDALHADCQRDLDIASQWGFKPSRHQFLAPTGGGINNNLFHADANQPQTWSLLNVSPETPIVINPRGIRQYTRTDMFFKAIPLVLRQRPETVFIGVNLLGNKLVESWINEYRISDNVRLTGSVDRLTMAQLFQVSRVMVSPTTHDGTPNTLLEGMACGAFPVVAEGVESIHEWITNGENGLFFNISDPQSQADAILKALDDEHLLTIARETNQHIIAERANYSKVMQKAEDFYSEIIAIRTK